MSRRDENEPGGVDLWLLKAALEAAGEAILITKAELEEPGPSIVYANPAFTASPAMRRTRRPDAVPASCKGQGQTAPPSTARAAMAAKEVFQGS